MITLEESSAGFSKKTEFYSQQHPVDIVWKMINNASYAHSANVQPHVLSVSV